MPLIYTPLRRSAILVASLVEIPASLKGSKYAPRVNNYTGRVANRHKAK